MSDSSDLDNGLIALLASDATLLALMPNGVYFGEAPPGSTAFVSVQIIDTIDEQTFGARGYEDILYVVKAVASSNTNMKAAAARIETLLENASLTVTGYSTVTCYRDGRHRPPPEPDGDDPAINWFQRGGFYRVHAAV